MRAYAGHFVRRYPFELAVIAMVYALAAVCGMVVPRLLGALVQEVVRGVDDITRAVGQICTFLAAQAILVGFASYRAARLGEKILANLREGFIANVLALPLGTVEQAGSGDLVTRTTRDVDMLPRTVRQALPDTLLAGTTITATLVAVVLVGPLLALSFLIAFPVLAAAARWYLARARDAYLRESASYSRITGGLTETAKGARTVEALRIQARRLARVNRDIAESYAAERYTLRLRTVFLPIVDTAYVLPVVATLLIGGELYISGRASLAAVTAATLYMQQLVRPVDVLLYWMNELQVGRASLARLLGVDRSSSRAGATAPAPTPGIRRPRADEHLVVRHVSYAYRDGHDVLHDIDLEVRRGERLAIVGPSGAGKSTLGRLLAGIHEPRTGVVTIAGIPLTHLPLADLRRQVALVTQESHVFLGTVYDNLVMAKPGTADDELERALRAVDAWEWVAELGLDAQLGSGRVALSPAQVQQLALARLVLADPHTLILDEATSLLDPRAARHLERSLAAVLEGRSVVAIAHRLHTAQDADRIVVMEGGRIREDGSHAELLVRGGAYAALWESWHGPGVPDAPVPGHPGGAPSKVTRRGDGR